MRSDLMVTSEIIMPGLVTWGLKGNPVFGPAHPPGHDRRRTAIGKYKPNRWPQQDEGVLRMSLKAALVN
jgi:hypothetical protein